MSSLTSAMTLSPVVGNLLILVAAVVGTLAFRRLFRPRLLPGIFVTDQWPIIGNWPGLFTNTHRFHDWKLEIALKAEVVEAECLQRTNPFLLLIEVISPRMLKYMLQDNFENFEKGPRFRTIFEELLGGGIFNSDGETWRQTRKTASHMFSAAKLTNFMQETFLKHAETLSDVLDKQLAKQDRAKAGPSYIDMQAIFLGYTLDAICEIGFGVKLGSLKREDGNQPPFAKAFDLVQEATIWRFLGPTAKWKIQRFFNLGPEKIIHAQMPVVNEFVYDLIRTRKQNAAMYEDAGDLLSLFLREKSDMSDEELRDLIINFMVAGRDTTAALLTWFFFEVSNRPEVRLQLLEEIETTFGTLQADSLATHGIAHDTLKRSVYLEAVLLETLRLHPPVPAENKRCIADCTFPDGSKIVAGSLVSWAPYTMCRLTSIWGPDALEFKPERWLTEPDATTGTRSLIQKSPYAFPVFNAGFRLCLGRTMAMDEAKTVAVTILRKHQLVTKPDHDPHYKLAAVMFMKHGLPMTVLKRED